MSDTKTEKPTLIAAATARSGYAYYPPYLNSKRAADGEKVVVTMRGDEGPDGSCGKESVGTFSKEDFAAFLAEASQNL